MTRSNPSSPARLPGSPFLLVLMVAELGLNLGQHRGRFCRRGVCAIAVDIGSALGGAFGELTGWPVPPGLHIQAPSLCDGRAWRQSWRAPCMPP